MDSVARTAQKWSHPESDQSPRNALGVLTPSAYVIAGQSADKGLYYALRQAVRENAFCLFYQPILDLRSDRIVGAEALLRWRKGTEVVSASEFIEALEKSDLLESVTEWTLREACRKAAWVHRTLTQDFRVAVNVAPQQWGRGSLSKVVDDALEQSGCNPTMLDLEITERTCLNDCASVQADIRRFRDQGISVSIDDFGTGHANFTCLRRFPVSHIKIDKYYCRHSKAQSRVLAPVVAAAHRAGITCTAEGVETEAQLRQLRLYGCDEAQGFYIGRPMDFKSLVEVIEERSMSEVWHRWYAS
jgi:EAL domain-containing protein (putative c-di-GMP-specific phosphodiesterase class I)